MFLGARDDVPDLLAAADVALVPSWEEPFGRVAIEAMAMGVPVVATESGGPPRSSARGGGLLAPPRTVPTLAAAIARLLDDPAARARMGEAGRQHATERYGLGASRHASWTARPSPGAGATHDLEGRASIRARELAAQRDEPDAYGEAEDDAEHHVAAGLRLLGAPRAMGALDQLRRAAADGSRTSSVEIWSRTVAPVPDARWLESRRSARSVLRTWRARLRSRSRYQGGRRSCSSGPGSRGAGTLAGCSHRHDLVPAIGDTLIRLATHRR